jgi:hypothetical protein
MSQLNFRSSEIRLATATLATIASLAPTLYFLRSFTRQGPAEHIKTFDKFIQSYSTRRPEVLVAAATWDFEHTVLPVSLGLPLRTLVPFKQHASMIFSLFSDFQMVPQADRTGKTVHLSRDTNTVIAHCKMGGKVNPESEMGAKLAASGIADWWTECVLFVQMTEDGKWIVGVREFVNSVKAEELQQRLSGILVG